MSGRLLDEPVPEAWPPPDAKQTFIRRGRPPAAVRGLLVLPCLPLVGCVSHTHEARPDGWDGGVPLVAFAGEKGHDADERYHLRPVEGADRPARCVAYQDARRDDRDVCRVLDAGAEGAPEAPGAPWTILARWEGAGERLHEDVELHPDARTVVAFDAEGRPVSHWDGTRRDPDGDFSTG